MCVASAALTGRTAGDALFLSRYSVDLLSYMYVGTALVVAGASYAYGLCTPRVPIDRLIMAICAVFIALTLALRVALATPWPGFRIAAYFMADLVVNVPMMLFWSFAALVFNPREAKRLFGFVGAAGTTSCILAGFFIRPFVARLGTENLLLLVAVFAGGFLYSTYMVSRIEPGRFKPGGSGSGSRPSAIGYYASLLQMCQVRNLVFLVVIATFALTLIDYQFKAAARLQYSGASLAVFFGNFYALGNVVAIFIQVLLVHRVFQLGGVLLALCLLPIGLLAASVCTAATAGFYWMVGTKLVVQVLAFTIDSVAIQMLYLGVRKQTRSQARAFVDGIGKPMAMAATGIGLVGVAGLVPLHVLGVGVAVASGVWLLLARGNYRAYVAALVDSLGARRFDLSQETSSFRDKNFTTHMRQALTSAPDGEITYLLGVLPEMGHIDWTPEFRQLLGREDPQVKIAALQYLQAKGTREDLGAVLSHTRHADPAVCAAAIYAAVELGDQEAVEEVEPALEDARPEVSAAAAASLINSGDLDRLLSAGVVLRGMLQADDPDVRVAAAGALSHIESSGLSRPIVGLLQDPESAVRLAAIGACKARPSAQLMPALVPLLADPAVAGSTADALVAFGPETLDHLIPYMDLSQMEGAFAGAYRIPDILSRIGDQKALPVLLRATEHPDARIRSEAIRAYGRMLQALPSMKPGMDDLRAVVRREVDAARERQQVLREVEGLPGGEILCDALVEEHSNRMRNAFALLDVAVPEVDMHAIHLSVVGGSGEQRANALEVLDNVLEGDLKSSLMAVLESTAAAQERPDEDVPDIPSLVGSHASEWTTAGAVYSAAVNPPSQAQEYARECLTNKSPVVRETALYALGRIGTPEEIRAACAELLSDTDRRVSDLARELSAAHAGEERT